MADSICIKRDIRKLRRSLNQCPNCGQSPALGKTKCVKCADYHNLAGRKSKAKKKLAGLCSCGKVPDIGQVTCRVCIEAHNQYSRKLKAETFEHYGHICVCCGETILMLLTIDHIENNGSTHRKELSLTGGEPLYLWLRRNHWPSGFQVLCFSCNHGKYLNGGVCPHQNMNADKEISALGVTPYNEHGVI